MTARFLSLLRHRGGSSAAEFALVLPLLMLFLFGIIDTGRYMWALNRAEKASQMGVRYAVVSDPVSDAVNVDYVTDYSIPGGDAVPASVFTSAVCEDQNDCIVTGTAASESGRNAAAFDAIVAWMKLFYPELTSDMVEVRYDNVGLGFSGDPGGPDVAPLTTVILKNIPFRPLLLFGGSVDMPDISASLTLEDGECSTTGDCGSSN